MCASFLYVCAPLLPPDLPSHSIAALSLTKYGSSLYSFGVLAVQITQMGSATTRHWGTTSKRQLGKSEVPGRTQSLEIDLRSTNDGAAVYIKLLQELRLP